MAFKKGDKKPANSGKIKGTKNKKTEQWEAFAEYCFNGGLKRYMEELNKLNGYAFVNAFQNQLEYFKPKLARTEVSGRVEHKVIEVVRK